MSRFGCTFNGVAYREEANRIYNESRVALNVSAGNDLNMRMFEGQATSALLVANAVHNGEAALLPYVPFFTGVEGCVERVRFFLEHPTILGNLSRHQAADMQEHTYEARARQFLEAIGFPGVR